MLAFDTNVLLYAADEDSEHHEACRRRIEDAGAARLLRS